MNETVDNRIAYQPSPDALAEISVETNNYAADVGNVAGAVISNVIKSGANQFQGNVFEFYRNSDFDANTWANNRSEREEGRAHAAHLRRHARRPDRQEQAVLLRGLPGHGPRPARVRARLRGPGRLAHRRPLEPPPGHRRQGPHHRRGLPEQPDSPEPDQPDRARDPERPDYPLPNREVTGVANNYVGDSLSTTRAHQGDLRLDWNASANDKLFLRFSIADVHARDRRRRPSRCSPAGNDRVPVPQPGGQLEPRLQLLADQRGPRRLQLHRHRDLDSYDWGGIGDANATYGIPGGQPIAGPELDRVRQRPHRPSGPAATTRGQPRRRATSSTRS